MLPPVQHECDHCHNQVNGKVLRCTQCQNQFYCVSRSSSIAFPAHPCAPRTADPTHPLCRVQSTTCAKAGWPSHRPNCSKYVDLDPPGMSAVSAKLQGELFEAAKLAVEVEASWTVSQTQADSPRTSQS